MLRISLITLLMIGSNAAQLPAQEKIATLEPFREFKGYPRNEMIGSNGHDIMDSWFTGRWYCAVIGAGVIGESKHIPFAGPGRPIKNERIVAIVAVDLESKTRQCLSITPQFQPNRSEKFSFRILTKDVFCLTAKKVAVAGKPNYCSFLKVSLSDKTIEVEQMPLTSAKRRLRTLAFDPLSGQQPLPGGGVLPKQSSKHLPWTLGDGWGGLDQIVLYGKPDPESFVGPGSRHGRLIQCEIIGPGQFAISERDANPAGRKYWLLSESAIEPQSKRNQSKITHLYFPRLLIAPVKNVVFAADAANNSPTLFSISNGRLRKLWDVPPGYSISGFELSEDESHAAVELSADSDSSNSDITVSIKVATGDVTVFPAHTDSAEFMFLVGVTNRGDLVQENASILDCGPFIRRRGWRNPRQIARLIRAP